MTSLLLDAGANPIASQYLSTPLEIAIQYSNRRILHLLAQKEPCMEFLAKKASEQDGTLIHIAARCGHEDGCRFLIEDLGRDMDWQSGRVGATALMFAISGKHFELIECFTREWHAPIKNHAAVLRETRWVRNFEETIQLLVDHCSLDINATDKSGHNALCFVMDCYYGSILSHARTLIQFGCSPDRRDCLGHTPMYCYIKKQAESPQSDFLDVMELLISSSQYGINQVDIVGRTVLHYFMECWTIRTVTHLTYHESLKWKTITAEDLMDLGVDRHIQSRQGRTALQTLKEVLGQKNASQGVPEEEHRRCVDRTIRILENYCTVPKY